MERNAERFTTLLADALAVISLIRAWLVLAAPSSLELTAVGLMGAVVAFALGVPLVSQIVRIMLYVAGLVAWLFVVPSQGAAMSATFLELVVVVLASYLLLRVLFRFARNFFWVIAVTWCVVALWAITKYIGW